MLEKYFERLLFASRWLLAPMFLGLALMVFPYFVGDPGVLFTLGTGLTASLFFLRG